MEKVRVQLHGHLDHLQVHSMLEAEVVRAAVVGPIVILLVMEGLEEPVAEVVVETVQDTTIGVKMA